MQISTPIIFIIFNRPETTQLVFNKIREVKPKKLYIIADAPRINNASDIENCAKTRDIIKNIDWECEVKKKYAVTNLGCGKNVSQGISWVFENEESAIILEDDCLPALPFFQYCESLLAKFKNDSRVMHIAGTNWHPEYQHPENASYFFSKDAHIWGWATWRRAWNLFDYEMKDYPNFIKMGIYKSVIIDKNEQRYFLKRWNSFYDSNYKSNSRSNWDYQWYYTVLKNKGLCVWPSSNLISNIGISGTHTDRKQNDLHFKETDPNYSILKHCQFILNDKDFDLYHYYNFNHIGLLKKMVNKIFKLLHKS